MNHHRQTTGVGLYRSSANWEVIGACLAAKLRQRTDRSGVGDAIDFAPGQRKAQTHV